MREIDLITIITFAAIIFMLGFLTGLILVDHKFDCKVKVVHAAKEYRTVSEKTTWRKM